MRSPGHRSAPPSCAQARVQSPPAENMPCGAALHLPAIRPAHIRCACRGGARCDSEDRPRPARDTGRHICGRNRHPPSRLSYREAVRYKSHPGDSPISVVTGNGNASRLREIRRLVRRCAPLTVAPWCGHLMMRGSCACPPRSTPPDVPLVFHRVVGCNLHVTRRGH